MAASSLLAAEFACTCGSVRARIANATPGACNRAICYCNDCQAFAHRVKRADLLDAKGGSDIVQVAPATMSFAAGKEHIAGLRLSPKGLFRFYARCCGTPLGNTVGLAIPMVGLPARGIQNVDRLFGPPRGALKGEYAIGGAPPGSKGFPLSLVAPAILKVLGWRLTGRARPHPFFPDNGSEPSYPVTVLTGEERNALRPLCGPAPASA